MFKSKDAVLNFIYSMGAAVVIFGALVKMTHLPIPGVSGNFILGLAGQKCSHFVSIKSANTINTFNAEN